MVFIALLRGINVGGKNKLEMKLLKKSCERIALQHVVTYINTGNIIFTDTTRTAKQIADELEDVIAADFHLSIKVMVRTLDEIAAIMSALPEDWVNDDTMKSDVLYLWDEIDNESAQERLTIVPDVDHVIYVPGALLWSCDRKHIDKSGMNKIVGTSFYKLVTVRNVNTARKLYELMQHAEQ